MLQLSPTKEESRPEILGRLRLEQGRILGTEVILTLPGCFINGMVRPLHLAEFYRLVASLSFCDFKNFYGVFFIREVFLEVNEFMINGLAGVFEALLEMIDVK